MVALLVIPLPDDRQGDVDGKGVRTYTRQFKVIMSDPFDAQIKVLTAPGIPRIYDNYDTGTESDAFAWCRKVTARQGTEDRTEWVARADYSSEIPDPSKNQQDPLDRRSRIEWDGVKFQRPVDQDVLTGKPVLNSAGQTPDPPLQVDDSRAILRITRNQADYNQALYATYADVLNADVFFGFAPGLWKCEPIKGSEEYENATPYWKVIYEFHLRLEGWAGSFLDAGFDQLNVLGQLNGVGPGITGITIAGNTATVTTAAAHGLNTLDPIVIIGAVTPAPVPTLGQGPIANPPTFNGNYIVASTPTTTTFTYLCFNAPAQPPTGNINVMRQGVVRNRVMLDPNGMKPSKPLLLDGGGTRLAAGGVPVYQSYTVYDSLPFAALSLP